MSRWMTGVQFARSSGVIVRPWPEWRNASAEESCVKMLKRRTSGMASRMVWYVSLKLWRSPLSQYSNIIVFWLGLGLLCLKA